MICSLTKSTIFFEVVIFKVIASTHLVKQSVGTNINLCPLLEGGKIWPIRSILQPRNGHGLIIGFMADPSDF
jgi:hypothetical protein